VKTIRFLASLFLLLTGIIHIFMGFGVTDNWEKGILSLFGVLYIIAGVLLLLDEETGYWFGLFFPLAGLGLGIFGIGISHWTVLLTALFAVDAIVVILCLVLLRWKHD
jgi:hypothetical protein